MSSLVKNKGADSELFAFQTMTPCASAEAYDLDKERQAAERASGELAGQGFFFSTGTPEEAQRAGRVVCAQQKGKPFFAVRRSVTPHIYSRIRNSFP